MAEILVLVDHVDGAVRKTTAELLTLARRAGEPSAVFFGSGYEAAKESLAEFGAAKVYVVDTPELSEYLVAPKAEALAQVASAAQPAAVLVSSSPEGTEVAARLAVKLGSGIITEAVDVAADLTTTQSVFAGGYTVTSRVTRNWQQADGCSGEFFASDWCRYFWLVSLCFVALCLYRENCRASPIRACWCKAAQWWLLPLRCLPSHRALGCVVI